MKGFWQRRSPTARRTGSDLPSPPPCAWPVQHAAAAAANHNNLSWQDPGPRFAPGSTPGWPLRLDKDRRLR